MYSLLKERKCPCLADDLFLVYFVTFDLDGSLR
jgi:hypothetical protein